MAIIQYSSLVNKIIGKVGGTVFQKMGQTSGIRAHVHHRPSNSNNANASRFKFNIIGATWFGLSASIKASWLAAQSSYTFYNRYGLVISLTAYQFFVYIQKVALTAGLTINSTPQNKYAGTINRGPISATCDSIAGFFVTFTNPLSTALYELISVSAPQLSSKQLSHPKYLLLSVANTTGYTTANLLSLFLKQNGNVYPSGYYISIQIKTWSVAYNQWVLENAIIIQCT